MTGYSESSAGSGPLSALLADLRRDGAIVHPPAGDAERDREARRIEEAFGMALPAEYGGFLRLCDGLTWNGLYLYGVFPWRSGEGEDEETLSPGLCEANTQRREYKSLGSLLLIGEVDDDFLAYDHQARAFVVLDRVSLQCFETYADLATCLMETVSDLRGDGSPS